MTYPKTFKMYQKKYEVSYLDKTIVVTVDEYYKILNSQECFDLVGFSPDKYIDRYTYCNHFCGIYLNHKYGEIYDLIFEMSDDFDTISIASTFEVIARQIE